MSYILDALRKSEKDRQQNIIRTASNVHQTPADIPKRPLRGRFLVSIIILTAVGLLILFLLQRIPNHSPVSSSETTVSHPKTAVSVPAPSSTGNGSRVSQIPAETGRAQSERETQRGMAQESVTKESSPDKLQHSSRINTRTESVMTSRKETGGATHQSQQHPQSSPALIPSFESESVALSLPPDAERTYALSELPQSVRKNIPNISISSLLHSHGDPSGSLIRINGQQFRNGQDIAPDLKILEILPNSVILSYQSYRFRISLE